MRMIQSNMLKIKFMYHNENKKKKILYVYGSFALQTL